MKIFLAFVFLLQSFLFAKEVLNVYTYKGFASSWGAGPHIKKEFEKTCENCEINFIALDDSAALVGRLKLENEKSKAHVVLGLDLNTMIEAQELGIFEKHNVNLKDLNMPNRWDNDIFVPFNYGYFAFIYDSKIVKNPPKSFEEFLNDKQKVIYQDPRTSTVGLGLILWMQKIYGKDIDKAYEKLSSKTLTVTKGWSESYEMFQKNQAPFVLSYTTSPAYHLIEEKNDRFKAAKFSEGHYMQVEVAAKTKKAPKLADDFLNFLVSKKCQSIIVIKNWMYPVVDIKLDENFDKLILVDPLLIDAIEVKKNRKRWIKEWRNAWN